MKQVGGGGTMHEPRLPESSLAVERRCRPPVEQLYRFGGILAVGWGDTRGGILAVVVLGSGCAAAGGEILGLAGGVIERGLERGSCAFWLRARRRPSGVIMLRSAEAKMAARGGWAPRQEGVIP